MILTLLQIAITIVCLIDLTDINTTYRKIIAYMMGTTEEKVKVNLCSLCITWWVSLAFIVFTGAFTITNLMLCAIIAVSTPIIQEVIRLTQDIIITLTNKLYEIIH